MCLISLAFQQDRYPLVVAANRDEFYGRPTAPAHFWHDAPTLLAGRDLEGGGTWLGITRAGRFAAVTNYREPGRHKPDAPSRGHLVTAYLLGAEPAAAYLRDLHRRADHYNGFNLLVGTPDDLYYYSNREGLIRSLTPGIYGLSNHLLDTAWPKVERGKRLMRRALRAHAGTSERLGEMLLAGLQDTDIAADADLPDTGVGLDLERRLSPLHIRMDAYGTRSSTVVLFDGGSVRFAEQVHAPGAASTKPTSFTLDLDAPRAEANARPVDDERATQST